MPTSTATATNLSIGEARPGLYFLLKRLHSLTGVIFGLYVTFHLLINASLVQFNDSFQVQVNKIHSLPFLNAIEWIFLFIPIIYHTLFGIYIIVAGRPNVGHYSYIRNWLYTLQRVTAVIVLLFIIFHVASIRYGLFGHSLAFNPENASGTVHSHMTAFWWVATIVYPIGLVATCFHTANGFWGAAITWGLTVSAGAQKRWGYVCAAIGLFMLALGLTAVVAAMSPSQSRAMPAEQPSQTVHALEK